MALLPLLKQKKIAMSHIYCNRKGLGHRRHSLFAPMHSPDLVEVPGKQWGHPSWIKKISRPRISKSQNAKKLFSRKNDQSAEICLNFAVKSEFLTFFTLN